MIIDLVLPVWLKLEFDLVAYYTLANTLWPKNYLQRHGLQCWPHQDIQQQSSYDILRRLRVFRWYHTLSSRRHHLISLFWDFSFFDFFLSWSEDTMVSFCFRCLRLVHCIKPSSVDSREPYLPRYSGLHGYAWWRNDTPTAWLTDESVMVKVLHFGVQIIYNSFFYNLLDEFVASMW